MTTPNRRSGIRLFGSWLGEIWRGPEGKHVRPAPPETEALLRAKTFELQMSQLVSTELSGDYASAFLGQGLSFAELRDYQPGDDPRNIQWNVTARFGRPFVKVFREERELRVVLLLDISSSVILTPRYQQALEFGALICSLSQKNRDQIGFGTFSEEIDEFIPPKSGRAHYRKVLYHLTQPREGRSTTNFQALMKTLPEKLPKRSNIFLLSDFEGEVKSDEFPVVTKAHDVTCVYLTTAPEEKKPLGMVRMIAPEAGIVGLVDSSSTGHRERTAQAEEKRWKETSRKLRLQGAEVVRFSQSAFQTLDEITRGRRKKRR